MNGIKESFGLAGLGMGLGILGDTFNSEGIKQSSQVPVNFIKPVINISMGGNIIKMLKGMNNGK